MGTSPPHRPTSGRSSRSRRRRWTRSAPPRCCRTWRKPPSGTAACRTGDRRGRRAGGTGRRRGALPDHPALPHRTGRRGGSRRAGPRPTLRRRVPGRPRAGGWPARPDPLGELGAGRGAHAGPGRRRAHGRGRVVPGRRPRATPNGGPAAPRRGKRSAHPWPSAYARWRQAEALLAARAPRGAARAALTQAWTLASTHGAALLVAEIQALARRARIELPARAAPDKPRRGRAAAGAPHER